MGTISIHLAPELQQTAGLNSSAQRTPAAAQIHPPQAEHVPLLQDTVTLSPQDAGAGQQSPEESQRFRPQLIVAVQTQPPVKTVAPLFPGEAPALGGAQLAAGSPSAAAVPSGRTDIAGSINAGGTAADPSTAGQETPSEALIQLDHTLRRLGINPQSISLTNRLSMLSQANSPAALRAVVNELRRLQQQGATAAVNNQPTPSNAVRLPVLPPITSSR
jgi:hypothetical protein